MSQLTIPAVTIGLLGSAITQWHIKSTPMTALHYQKFRTKKAYLVIYPVNKWLLVRPVYPHDGTGHCVPAATIRAAAQEHENITIITTPMLLFMRFSEIYWTTYCRPAWDSVCIDYQHLYVCQAWQRRLFKVLITNNHRSIAYNKYLLFNAVFLARLLYIYDNI